MINPLRNSDTSAQVRVTLRVLARQALLLLSCGASFAPVCIQPLSAQVAVTTSSNDIGRTGQNLSETVLTLSNVNSTGFGKLFSQSVDGFVYAQPLYLPNISISGAQHNVVFVATEHDGVYAFDADSNSGIDASPLWYVSLLSTAHGAASGATTVPSSLLSADISPEVGVTGTPVIDPSTGTLYVVSKTMEGASFVQRLHALDVTSGAEKFGGPVTIAPTVAGTGSGSSSGQIVFDSEWENQRPGLLLLNGVVYAGFAAHGDNGPWHGWILGFSAATLKPTGIFCASPNGVGAGVWMTGVGLAAEVIDPVSHPFGRMFVPTGNGDFNANSPFNALMDFGDSILNLDLSQGVPTVQDAFTPSDQATLDASDGDLGAGGIVILPMQTTGSYPHLLVQAGKSGEVYLLNRESLGGYHAGGDEVVQAIPDAVGHSGSWNTPAYWNGTVYYWAQNDNLKAFPLVAGQLTGPAAVSSEGYGFPGANPSISANGDSQGIVWSVRSDDYQTAGPAVLQAHDASNVATTLYSSSTNAARDGAGPAVKYVVPTVVNGKVYVGTQYQLDVFGLLNGQQTTATPVLSPGSENFTGTLTVSMADLTPGAVIHYTSDGSTPTASSAIFTGPVVVGATETLNAIAFAPGFSASPVATATYTSASTSTAISFPLGFAGSQGTMILNGSTDLDDSRLQLTDGAQGEAGSAWYFAPVNILAFTTNFTFQLSNPNADGMTFAIQGAGLNALGAAGGGLGYQNIAKSLAIKFDLHNNAGEGPDSTGLFTDGASPTIPAVNLSATGINLHSGDTMEVNLAYNGTTLSMTIVDVVTGASYFTSWTVDIASLVGGNSAYVGFTGGTGGNTSSQKILTWTYSTGAAPPPVLVLPAPTFFPAGGTYVGAQSVTIVDATAGAAIYFTTDGSIPTASSRLYSGPLIVSVTETIQAIGVEPGNTSSAVAAAMYSINPGATSYANYPSGQFQAASFSLNGGPTITSTGALQLTDGNGGENRSAWFLTEVPVGNFTTDFNFQQLNAAADGMTFSLQRHSAVATGNGGGGLGYTGIPASVAIKFDLHNNAGEGIDSTGLYIDGAAPTVPAVNLGSTAINLHSGDVMHAHLVYDGANLTMTLTDTITNGSVVEVFPIDIPGTVGGSTAWAGFTGGTGGKTSTQNVLSWTYSSN